MLPVQGQGVLSGSRSWMRQGILPQEPPERTSPPDSLMLAPVVLLAFRLQQNKVVLF